MHSRTQGTEQTVPYRLIANIYHLWVGDSSQSYALDWTVGIWRDYSSSVARSSPLETGDEGSRLYLPLALPRPPTPSHLDWQVLISVTSRNIRKILSRSPPFCLEYLFFIDHPSSLSYPLFRDTTNGCWTRCWTGGVLGGDRCDSGLWSKWR